MEVSSAKGKGQRGANESFIQFKRLYRSIFGAYMIDAATTSSQAILVQPFLPLGLAIVHQQDRLQVPPW